jgi:hypothetical protein
MGLSHRRLFQLLAMEYAAAPSKEYYPLTLTSFQFFERSNDFCFIIPSAGEWRGQALRMQVTFYL